MKLLVTTGLEESWGSQDESLLFLGEWCLQYNRRMSWSERSYEVVRNHWDDRVKLRVDERRLKKLHDLLLIELTVKLNKLHGVDYTSVCWQMILDPWLLSYVAVVWDRWECIRLAIGEYNKIKTYILASHHSMVVPRDFNSASDMFVNDSWNHNLFADIITTFYTHNCEIKILNDLEKKCVVPEGKNKRSPRSLRLKSLHIIDSFLEKLSFHNRYLFVNTYFPIKSFICLMLSLRQVPCFNFSRFDYNDIDIDGNNSSNNLRQGLNINLQPIDAFEDFLFKRLVKEIPKSYVEDFLLLRKRSSLLPHKPMVIATANSHWGDDQFSVWTAERVLKGARLIVMEHGGSIPPYFDSMEFENEIAYNQVVWTKPTKLNQTQLSPNTFLSKRHCSMVADICTIIGYEGQRYAYRASAQPIAGQCLVHFKMVCDLYAELIPEMQSRIRIKPYPNRGWDFAQRYRDFLSADIVLDDLNTVHVMARSKVIICTYPNTTFSQAILSGRPTVLYYPSHLWETQPSFDKLIANMREVGIVHEQSDTLARHLESIWKNPDKWWMSVEVQSVLAEFHASACRLDCDWLQEWTVFFKSIDANC